MNLVSYKPYTQRRRPRMGVPSIFDDVDGFFAPFSAERTVAQAAGGIKVDIYEKDNIIHVEAELPGMAKDDITVDIRGKLLTVSGERKTDTEVKEEQRYRRERSYGTFSRTFSMPFAMDPNSVTARFADGILKLEIARPAEQQTRKITVN